MENRHGTMRASERGSFLLSFTGAIVLLALLNHLAQFPVNGLHHFKAAVFFKCIAEYGLESGLLRLGRHRGFSSENGVDKFRMDIRGVFCIVERIVNVCGAVVEGREHKSKLRWRYDPVSLTIMELIFDNVVA